MIGGWIVPQWPTAGWRGREIGSVSIQEAGFFRTRQTKDGAPS